MREQRVVVEYGSRMRVERVVVVSPSGSGDGEPMVELVLPGVLEVRRVIRDGERPRVEVVLVGHLVEVAAGEARQA